MKRAMWAVVQDLRPFGYRVWSTHGSETEARTACGHSAYMSVMPLASVDAENKRMAEPVEFDRELAAWPRDHGSRNP